MSEVTGTNRPPWQADTTHPDLADVLREGLKDVLDPELGLNVVQLGLIRDLEIDDQGARIQMILTTPFCPYGPALIESTQQKAQEVLKIPTNVDISMEPWDFSMMEEGLGGEWGIY